MPNANQDDADRNTDQNSNLSPDIEAIISKIPSTTDNDPIIMDAQDSQDGEILDSDAAPDDGGEWYPARAPRKRRYKETSSQDSEKDAPRTESLTVIFVPTKEGDRISSLSSLKLTDGLDLLCPECIVQIRPNERLNLIAVDVRNGFTTRTLLKCTRLCGLPVKAYEGLADPTVEGVIKNVDAALPEAKIAGRLQSDTEIARVRRFGSSESVWITFRGSKLPSHVLLGRVRHPVMEFHHRPTQCYRCGGFGHYAVTCKRSVACSRCDCATLLAYSLALLRASPVSGGPARPRERESGLPSEWTAVWSGSPGLDSGQRVQSRREIVRPAMTPR
ncbi:hypothetical protein HPB47_018760 [Ixodes persulcatus]|uniref:Uncharacterized protein n=1 Tax=Ixodes persulcatus TaxID=34615 RepID=A0AC60QJW2_IXOPE|nr:hypothetical protein HPB47_018760 [Ixodes persulcatus]